MNKTKKVRITMKEEDKYKIIKKLVDSHGNKKKAAIKIGCSVRNINRLIEKYKSKGKDGFVHGNRCRPPINKIDDDLRRNIIDEYLNNYKDANITHFSEIVEEDFRVKISPETLRLWLLEDNVVSIKTHKVTKKRIKKRIKEELKKNNLPKKEANKLKDTIELIDRKDAHPRRQRCKYFGEMIQMDASDMIWVEGLNEKWSLHLAIDDATSRVVGAYFDYQETLNGYYHVFAQILLNYGIPAMFYTDRRTVFEYKRKTHVFDDEDTFTQFSYACHKLGVYIKTTSVPQAKGRIERLNSSFQSRLPIELRRANVKTIEEANIFLKSYLEKYNYKFSLQINTTKTVFDHQLTINDINDTLSVLSVRVIDHGNTIKFKNKVYIPINDLGTDIYLQEGMKVIMVETFDGRLIVNVFDNLFRVRELSINQPTSKEFDETTLEELNDIAKYLKPRKTPWRYDDFLGFLAKQKHRQDN